MALTSERLELARKRIIEISRRLALVATEMEEISHLIEASTRDSEIMTGEVSDG